MCRLIFSSLSGTPGVLDPITSTLTSYEDMDDLMEKCDRMFDRLDADGDGGAWALCRVQHEFAKTWAYPTDIKRCAGLRFEEFKSEIRNLPGTEQIHLTTDDFEVLALLLLPLFVPGRNSLRLCP